MPALLPLPDVALPPPRTFPPVNDPRPEPPAQSQDAVVRKLTRNDDLRDSRRPDATTAALPGTAEKCAGMTARVAAGRSPFHPDDLTMDDCMALGYSCTTDANGYTQWNRPVNEGERRELILAALAARRLSDRLSRGRRKVG